MMATFEEIKEELLNFERWFPCKPREVLTATLAHDLWLVDVLIGEVDTKVWMRVNFVVTDGLLLPSGFTKFEFNESYNTDNFKTYGVKVLTDPRDYETRFDADDVIIYWYQSDWKE